MTTRICFCLFDLLWYTLSLQAIDSANNLKGNRYLEEHSHGKEGRNIWSLCSFKYIIQAGVEGGAGENPG